jgi:hypothetical protein
VQLQVAYSTQPVLIGDGDVLLSTGANYTRNGPIIGAISSVTYSLIGHATELHI